jgi:hypothetical protein
MMGLLTKEDLDTIEREYIKALKFDVDPPPAAAVIDQQRKILIGNGRLVITPRVGDSSELLDEDVEADDTQYPFAVK